MNVLQCEAGIILSEDRLSLLNYRPRRQQYSRSRRGPFTGAHLRLIAVQGQRNDGSRGANDTSGERTWYIVPFFSSKSPFLKSIFILLLFRHFSIAVQQSNRGLKFVSLQSLPLDRTKGFPLSSGKRTR